MTHQNDNKFKKLDEVYEAVRKIINIGELYLVGGCVRDSILGREPKDFDFCTNLLPDEVEELVKNAGLHVCAIGKKFGTIGFKVEVIEHNDYNYENDWGPQWDAMGKFVLVEVTTYRGEKYVSGNRKPEVTFSDSLEFDLSRRDFTMNAMAYGAKSPQDKVELIDNYGGRINILDKVIKSVGDSKARLNDDPLRILRAVRFANRYGFDIENNLSGMLGKFRDKLFDVAVERWVIELDSIIKDCTHPVQFTSILNKYRLLEIILPELIDYSSGIKKIKVNSSKFQRDNLDDKWKEILMMTGWTLNEKEFKWKQNTELSRYINSGICHRLRFSNSRTKRILG